MGRFALALATIAIVASAATPPKVAVNFGTSLNSKAAWNSFKEKTVDHGNQSNTLMKSRNTAVQAWFAAKTASAKAGAASTKAAAKAASKRVLRNTATKNSVDANTALTGANTDKATAAAAKTAQAASKATNDTAVAKTGTANVAAAK